MGAKRRRSRFPGFSWVTYERSYLVTVGLALVALTAVVWKKQGDTFSRWPTWSYFLFFGLPLFGLLLIAVGLLARRNRIEKWADALSGHHASIIVMILALPVFLAMSMFRRRN